MTKASPEMEKYFEGIDKNLKQCYDITIKAREKGYEPETKPSIQLAKNMAERVEGLISIVAPQIMNSGVAERLEKLESKYGAGNWNIAMIIALEVAQEKFCKFKDKHEAIEVGLRTGLAYVTNGVVASPLEGFTRLVFKKTKKGKEYFALYFAGPIRSAGTTAVCVFAAVADYVRKQMGYAEYDPTEDEIKRQITEVNDFHDRITNLQYLPSDEELEFMVRSLPVQIDGEPSEKLEVSNYKDLDRIETNVLRNGVCLVLGEGLTQKAAKFWGRFSKDAKEMQMEHWDFLDKFIKIQKRVRAKGEEETEAKLKPDYNYIKDLVAGRPVITHPLAKGGLRLRYGRTRTSGFSSMAISPATMVVLEDYIAIGTQLKVERPNKATTLAVCDSIDGPIVKLKNGSVRFLKTKEEAVKCFKEIEEVLFLGDILIAFGDFFNRAHKLIPPGYCEEWWALELEKVLKGKRKEQFIERLLNDPIKEEITIEQAIDICKKYDVPLHPQFTYHWCDINKKQFIFLLDWLSKSSIEKKEGKVEKIILPVISDIVEDPKRTLELLGVQHDLREGEAILINGSDALSFLTNLGLEEREITVEDVKKIDAEEGDVLKLVNHLSHFTIRDKSGTCIGARMGRPEKAKQRKLIGSPQVLFPVGSEGGRLKCFQQSLETGSITGQFPIRFCEKCDRGTIYPICEECGSQTEQRYFCEACNKDLGIVKICPLHGPAKLYKEQTIDIRKYFDFALKKIGMRKYPDLIKGVRGTSNKDHIPENLIKGILRAQHKIFVNRDGTTRYDISETMITHFKPKEIRTSVEKLKQLGYKKDIKGNDLKDEDQILEIFAQDVILPSCPAADQEGADEVLFRVTKFVDDLLEKLYGLKKFYDLKKKEDLVGHLILGMSPHTSAGITGRIIGFSKTQGYYTSPLFHSFMRRDCDGDEACAVLLMDALLNFSRQYLPDHRGATQDAPLVLSSRIIPAEVDDMVFDLDTCWKYPLELYESAMEYKEPWDIKIERYKERLGKESQYEGLGYTHELSDMNSGVLCSAYKFLPTMEEKVKGQMRIAERLRAVDENDIARLVIERHFIRDLRGNLRQFSSQRFRCVKCNEKFRRPPLIGKCTKCGGKIIFTVSEGSVIKYLAPSLSLAEKYDVPPYVKQNLELVRRRIESVFGKDPEKQEGLGKWFSK